MPNKRKIKNTAAARKSARLSGVTGMVAPEVSARETVADSAVLPHGASDSTVTPEASTLAPKGVAKPAPRVAMVQPTQRGRLSFRTQWKKRTLRQHVLIDEASSEHFLDEKIVCSDNCSPFCNEAKKLSDERCELINKIFSADGFFDQMEETRREKGVESKEYKLLLQVSDATKTYLDRVLKGNLVGLAADFKKTVPGEEINAIFDNNFGIIHVVACMECWEEKLRLKKMSNALILNVVLCNGYNEELFNVLEQVKVAKTSWRD